MFLVKKTFPPDSYHQCYQVSFHKCLITNTRYRSHTQTQSTIRPGSMFWIHCQKLQHPVAYLRQGSRGKGGGVIKWPLRDEYQECTSFLHGCTSTHGRLPFNPSILLSLTDYLLTHMYEWSIHRCVFPIQRHIKLCIWKLCWHCTDQTRKRIGSM